MAEHERCDVLRLIAEHFGVDQVSPETKLHALHLQCGDPHRWGQLGFAVEERYGVSVNEEADRQLTLGEQDAGGAADCMCELLRGGTRAAAA